MGKVLQHGASAQATKRQSINPALTRCNPITRIAQANPGRSLPGNIVTIDHYRVIAMSMTNAQIQSAYRARHIKDIDTANARRVDTLIDSASMTALKRLAAHYRVSQRGMLQKLIVDAQTALFATLDGDAQDAYCDAIKAK
jgi:hypothetical protein